MKKLCSKFVVITAITSATLVSAETMTLESAPPVIVKTLPVAGATDVDPTLTEIRVTYSKAMQDGSWSWSTWGKENYPETTGKPRYLEDNRTCVLPVKLQPGKFYALWLNSDQFHNFLDSSGTPAVSYLLTFRTAGGFTFVRIVLDGEKMTFEDQHTSWSQIETLLKAVPDHAQTVLEWAVPSDQITLQQQNEWSARFSGLARRHGFAYASYVGVHPFGSKGGETPRSNKSEARTGADDKLSSDPATFGQVIETILKNPEKRVAELLNLDTEERATSKNFGENDRETHVWIREHNLDLLGVIEKGQIALLCMDMVVPSAPNNSFDKLTPQEVLTNWHLAQGEPNKITAISPTEEKTDTFFFRTREGGQGVLQILGRSENPSGVKIRYKLVTSSVKPASSTETATRTLSALIAGENWGEMMKLVPQAIRLTDNANAVEGAIQTNFPILLEWDMSLPMAATTGMEKRPSPELKPGSRLEFPPDGRNATAHLRHDGWPHAAWEFQLEIFDAGGKSIKQCNATLENSGKRPPKRQSGIEQSAVRFDVGPEALSQGKRFRLSVESLWAEQEGEFQFAKELPLYFGLSGVEYSGMFRAEWLKFDPTNTQAIIHTKLPAWPKCRWKVHLELFDGGGRPAGEGKTVVENAGFITSDPATTEEDIRFHVANPGSGTQAPRRFRLRVERIPDNSSSSLKRDDTAASESTNVSTLTKSKSSTDQIIVEDLALQMLVAIREKDDTTLKSLATDRVTKGWRDALPEFAMEMRERFLQMTGKQFTMFPGKSVIEGDFAAVECTGPKELNGIYLILYFTKTAEGWKNCFLQNSPPTISLAKHFADFKARQKTPSKAGDASGTNAKTDANRDQTRAVAIFNDIEDFGHEFDAAFSAKNLPAAQTGVRRLLTLMTNFNAEMTDTNYQFPASIFDDIAKIGQALDQGDWEKARALAHHNEEYATRFRVIGNHMADLALSQRLNDDQRAVLEWTDRQFRSYFDARTFEGLPKEERSELETRLLDQLKGPRSRNYYTAINSLAALHSKKAIEPLRAIAFDRSDKDNRDRWMAIRALGIIGDKASVSELIHLVYHGNINTRWWAQISLVRLTGQNFGKDWKAWGEWWKKQNGQPPFQPEIIRWWSGQPEPDKLAETLEENDREFLSKVRATEPTQ